MDTTKQATVLSYSRTRGIGWAVPDDGGNDVFVHRSSLPPERRYLNEDDRISYEIGYYNGKPCAANVKYLGHVIAVQRSAPIAAADPVRTSATHVPALLRNMPKAGRS